MEPRRGRLTETQLALARAFFRQTKGFFLTGGAVLAGWELKHRPTDDLDLFTDSDDMMYAGAGGPSVGLWCAGTSNPQRTGIRVTTGGGGTGGQPKGITGLTQTTFGCP